MSEQEKSISVTQVQADQLRSFKDQVAIEEPLEIRIVSGPDSDRRSKGLSITMRTPGHDFELSAGFLVSESIVAKQADVRKIEYCGRIADGQKVSNIINVELHPEAKFDIQNLQRHFYTTSSCGVCGKASLEALEFHRHEPLKDDCKLDRSLIFGLPEKLRAEQKIFTSTGGIHAAGLFDLQGKLIEIREDVGRHNALDKLVGFGLLNGKLPFCERVLVVSGRASFELLQKTLAANIPIFVAVGAPSSLAVELAERFNISLVGFTSGTKFNIYTGAERIS